MNFNLIPPEAYEKMPKRAEEKFAYLANVAQGSLTERLSIDQEASRVSNDYYEDVKGQFVDIIYGLAEEFQVKGLPGKPMGTANQNYNTLMGPLAATLVRIQARTAQSVSHDDSVELGYKTKAWLRQEITHLIGYVNESNLPQWKKDSLREKLAQLLVALEAKRFSYAIVMAALVPLAAVCAGATTTAVNAPKIVAATHSIFARLGEAFAEEEQESIRISGPPLCITDQSQSSDEAS